VDSTDEQADSPPPLERIIEGLLFVGGGPLTADRAAEVVRGLTTEQFGNAIAGLNRAYREQGRPYRVVVRGEGHELALCPGFRGVVERLHGATREARLSQPALDALALVAYRQPVSRPEVDALRGADSVGLLRQLVHLGLVAVQPAEGGQPAVYVTTPRFLKLFQLRSLDDLPRTLEIQQT
jgi:segregation and condensation protein B